MSHCTTGVVGTNSLCLQDLKARFTIGILIIQHGPDKGMAANVIRGHELPRNSALLIHHLGAKENARKDWSSVLWK
jgi:hypothetical protein